MEMETSDNFIHGNIGGSSQNYGGSTGTNSIHSNNNFGQMQASGYGSSQSNNARSISIPRKSIQSNMHLMGTAQGSSNMAGVSLRSSPQPMPKLQFADVEHSGTPQDTTFMTHDMASSNNRNVMFEQNQGSNSAHMMDGRSSSNVNRMTDQSYGSNAALSKTASKNWKTGMRDQSYKSVGYY